MIVVLGLGVCFAAGVEPRKLALLAGAVYLPIGVGALLAFLVWRARPDDDDRAVLFCEGVASELRAGASLGDALASAANSVGETGLAEEAAFRPPIAEIAARVSDGFPVIGEELRLTVVTAARAGSDSAALFDEIGSLALAKSEIRREVRVATAPGRVTALVLLGAPLVYLFSQLGSGGISNLLASSQQRTVALAGMGLFLAGLGAAGFVVWRAGR
ncbi:MAG: type II secretion system F family protein [Acidimicrobiia bacterium]